MSIPEFTVLHDGATTGRQAGGRIAANLDCGRLPVVWRSSIATNFRFSYRRETSDTSYRVETSGNLLEWTLASSIGLIFLVPAAS